MLKIGTVHLEIIELKEGVKIIIKERNGSRMYSPHSGMPGFSFRRFNKTESLQ